ncbi:MULTISPECIES: helix-turn-helix transcriptional regulator [Bradyrhizobium]|uniref:helix-turn-helix domain-containing protein n=1 Tax=Bradyrhizobium TaxID=374 RepID=UPI00056B5D33|nr:MULTISPECIES: helix-turn-helix transcriptional regulator [Bradyrhizobium]MCA1375703.1 helix-turn-helix transcriptional regulator [Bradyrhizobium sp. IC4060]MCA1485701.1 helix-turn-helix transcriptional regulator [Bradyrhizobium sp. IC4061]
MNFETKALAYLRHVLETRQMKPGALAIKAGLSPSTLTRALNDPGHKFKLSMTTLEKIAEASGINPGPFLEAEDAAALTLNEVHRPDLEPARAPENPFKWTLIVGEVQANVWKEPAGFPYMDVGPLHLTSVVREPKDCFAYIMRDESANMLAAPNDILFCTRIGANDLATVQREEPHRDMPNPWRNAIDGPVIVERRSKDAFKVEITLRYLRRQRGAHGWELLSARSEDYPEAAPPGQPAKRRLFAPVELPQMPGTEEYRVVGRCEFVLRNDIEALNYLATVRPKP